VGDRSYVITATVGESSVHVDALKPLVVPATQDWRLHPEDLEEILRELELANVDFLSVYERGSLSALLQESWDGRSVFAGVCFREAEVVWAKFKASKEVVAVLVVVPEFPYSWFDEMKSTHAAWSAEWVHLSDFPNSLLDGGGNPMGRFPYPVWVVKFSHM
jgi:hypothetical protein